MLRIEQSLIRFENQSGLDFQQFPFLTLDHIQTMLSYLFSNPAGLITIGLLDGTGEAFQRALCSVVERFPNADIRIISLYPEMIHPKLLARANGFFIPAMN
jgi:hypothetical protein